MRRKRAAQHAPFLILSLVLLAGGLAALLIPVQRWHMEIEQDAQEYDRLREQVKSSGEISPQTQPKATNTPSAFSLPSQPLFLPEPEGASEMTAVPEIVISDVAQDVAGVDMAALTAENPDFIAWLTIPATSVDYPVVITDDPEYTLNHTFSGKESAVGTLFSLAGTDYETPGRNIAIYGHHLRSADKMFSLLLSYKKRRFRDEHETVILESLYRRDTYKVFAVLDFTSGEWNPSRASFDSDEDFLDFIRFAQNQSLYASDIEVGADDHILTLITCDRSYGGKSGRLAVMAVRQ